MAKFVNAPPSVEDIISDVKKHFGIDTSKVFKEERIFSSMVDLWKKLKRPPSLSELSDVVGAPPTTCCFYLRRLVNQKRLLRVTRGVYIPIPEKNT